MTDKNAGEFAGKCALVTGGTTGIGRATAELLHAAGARVAITGQNPDTLATAARELPSDVLVLKADSRSVADAARLAEQVKERFGKLDVVFLNAGIAQLAPFEAVDEAFYQEHMDVNVKGVVPELPSARLTLLMTIAGGASLSVIVPMPAPLTMNPFAAFESPTVNVSSYSSITSPRTATVIVLLVWPAVKVSVPEVAL